MDTDFGNDRVKKNKKEPENKEAGIYLEKKIHMLRLEMEKKMFVQTIEVVVIMNIMNKNLEKKMVMKLKNVI